MGLETILLGAAASAGAPATAGLFGVGGAFNALTAAGTAFSGLSAASSIIGGAQQQKESGRQAQYALEAATLRGQEAARVANRQARQEVEAAEDLTRRQKVAYLASGVALQGSPLLVMEETRRKGAENAEEILAGGQASQDAALLEGRLQADSVKSAGKQAFMGGLTSAVQTIGGRLA